jgi:hypothetical protein
MPKDRYAQFEEQRVNGQTDFCIEGRANIDTFRRYNSRKVTEKEKKLAAKELDYIFGYSNDRDF